MTSWPVPRRIVDQAVVESARLGCPENWCRDLARECGHQFTQRTWDRYWSRVCMVVDRPGPWTPA